MVKRGNGTHMLFRRTHAFLTQINRLCLFHCNSFLCVAVAAKLSSTPDTIDNSLLLAVIVSVAGGTLIIMLVVCLIWKFSRRKHNGLYVHCGP